MKSYALLLAAAFLFISLSLPAQDKDPFQAYRAEVLEVYLDRADLQQRREDWLNISEAGSSAAEAAWEKNAVLLFENGVELQEARRLVQERISCEVEKRFAEWLVRRFLERRALASFDWLYAAVQQQNLSYLYLTDQGKIRRDESGDPLLKDGSELAEDRARWRQAVQEAIGNSLDEWR